MSASEELEALVQSMIASEPEPEDGENSGDVVAWTISYSTFRD